MRTHHSHINLMLKSACSSSRASENSRAITVLICIHKVYGVIKTVDLQMKSYLSLT